MQRLLLHKPARNVTSATLKEPPPFLASDHLAKATGARKKGLLYERKVKEYLAATYKEDFLDGPWFSFQCGPKDRRWCQPDGLLFLPEKELVIVIEVKLRHTIQAWLQLTELYIPVVKRALLDRGLNFKLAPLEITRWFDPLVYLPEQATLLRDAHLAQSDRFSVHIWPSHK